jgi:hypothetical protein
MTEFYLCPCCEQYHPADFAGDCRDDANRFNPEELDETCGPFGWVEVEPPQ